MRNIRIYIEHDLQPGIEIALPEPSAAHVVRVLRMRVGDPLVLFNGDGNDYASELADATTRVARVRVVDVRVVANETPLRITLAQALARGEKMDWIIQKATELGAAAIIPLLTERSEVRLDDTRAGKRLAHWRGVAIGACEQCGRARIPALSVPMALQEWLASSGADGRDTRLALLPRGETTVRGLAGIGNEVRLAVGPEGGFGDNDVETLRAAGFIGLSLGPRVLRTETAGIAAMASLQSLFGDF